MRPRGARPTRSSSLRLKQQSFLSQFSDDAKSGSGEDGSSISPSSVQEAARKVAAAEAQAIKRIEMMATQAISRTAGGAAQAPYQFCSPTRGVPATRSAAAAAAVSASASASASAAPPPSASTSRSLRSFKRQRRSGAEGGGGGGGGMETGSFAPLGADEAHGAVLWDARPASADMTVGALRSGPWEPNEDRHILRCVQQGMSRWSSIAQHVPGRSGKQCRDRWFNFLEPTSRKGGWSEDEDRILEQLVSQFQSQWSRIALRMPGRSESAVANRWKTLRKLKHLEHCLGSSGDAAGLGKAIAAISADSSLMALSLSLDDSTIDALAMSHGGVSLGQSQSQSQMMSTSSGGVAPMSWPLAEVDVSKREAKAQQTAAGLVKMGMLSPPFAAMGAALGFSAAAKAVQVVAAAPPSAAVIAAAAASASASSAASDIFATGGVINMVPHRAANSMGPPQRVAMPFTVRACALERSPVSPPSPPLLLLLLLRAHTVSFPFASRPLPLDGARQQSGSLMSTSSRRRDESVSTT